MGLTKTELFTDEQNKIASAAKVLGHPARIAILQHIIREKTCICGDLVEETGLSQPTISQHLRELKQSGILKGEIEGTKVCYCIEHKTWDELRSLFDRFFVSVEPVSDECC